MPGSVDSYLWPNQQGTDPRCQQSPADTRGTPPKAPVPPPASQRKVVDTYLPTAQTAGDNPKMAFGEMRGVNCESRRIKPMYCRIVGRDCHSRVVERDIQVCVVGGASERQFDDMPRSILE
jgi:hypothetical protein